MSDIISRWFRVDYRPNESVHTYTCEVYCRKTDGMWTVMHEAYDASPSHHNLWVALAQFFEHNDLEIMRITEMDRAGNPIYYE